MDINKQAMTMAYLHRDEPKYFRQFIQYIDQIGNFCVRRLKIDPLYRDDVKQIAVEHAYRKIDHYDPNSGSAAYSFFYKVILRRCLYELRDMNKKKMRMPDICSLDKLYNSCSDDSDDPTAVIDIIDNDMNKTILENPDFDTSEDKWLSYDPASDTAMVMINGKSYSRAFAVQKIKEAKSIVRREKLIVRRNRLFSLKANEYFRMDDEFIHMVCVQIIENKEKKAKSFQRSK